jgi:hypothetical protein
MWKNFELHVNTLFAVAQKNSLSERMSEQNSAFKVLCE